MNAKFRNIASQSGFSMSQAYSAEFNKFAELLMQECIQAIEDSTPKISSGDHGRGLQLGHDRAILALKNRFGVEE
jgi:hypothetical protein